MRITPSLPGRPPWPVQTAATRNGIHGHLFFQRKKYANTDIPVWTIEVDQGAKGAVAATADSTAGVSVAGTGLDVSIVDMESFIGGPKTSSLRWKLP
jgi:hypothetical protein